MPPNIKLILNPICNHGRSLQNAADLRPILANQDAEWSGTEYPGHAIELARQAGEQGVELVVALGGDGTVHEVVNGLMQVAPEKRPALGIIPLGSGNDFAHILQIPSDPAGIIDMETFSQIREMDEVEDDDDESAEGGAHAFSKGIVWGYFEQAENTFKQMEDAM